MPPSSPSSPSSTTTAPAPTPPIPTPEPEPIIQWPFSSSLGHLLSKYTHPPQGDSRPRNPPIFPDSSELKLFIPLMIHEFILSTPPPYFSGLLWPLAAERIADMALDYMIHQPTFQDGMSHVTFRLAHSIEGRASKRLLTFHYKGEIECPKQPPFRFHQLDMKLELRDPSMSEKEFTKMRDELVRGQTPFKHDGPNGWWGSPAEVRERIHKGIYIKDDAGGVKDLKEKES